MAKKKNQGKNNKRNKDWKNKIFLCYYLKSGFPSIFKNFRKGSQHRSENTVGDIACILLFKYGLCC